MSVATALLPCAVAEAHGEPPRAHAVVRADAEGPLLIKLGAGLAAREQRERFRFICPALWGGELASPAAALADGSVVIGANSGLMLLEMDGTLRAHPDALAQGYATELVATREGVFALRFKDGKSEVVAVDAQQARVVWSDAKTWYSLAPLESGLLLLRSTGTLLEQLVVGFDGLVRAQESAVTLGSVDYPFARALGDEAFALLLRQNAPELGRVQGGVFTRVAQGASSIAGPIATGTGGLLAIDGQLHGFDGKVATPLADTSFVSCLEQGEHDAYACTREGVSRVSAAGLGEPLFALSWLTPPDLSQLADDKARARCDYQWQDLRFDLLALGMALRFEDEAQEAESDAGAGAADAEIATADAARGDREDEAPRRRDSSGCSVGERGATFEGWAVAAGLLGLIQRRRRGRGPDPGR
jgi:hypothetical protein